MFAKKTSPQRNFDKIENYLKGSAPCRRPPFLEAVWFGGVVVKGSEKSSQRLFWAIFDLEFGCLAKNYVGRSAPDLKRRLGVEFPEGTFFPQTPVVGIHGGRCSATFKNFISQNHSSINRKLKNRAVCEFPRHIFYVFLSPGSVSGRAMIIMDRPTLPLNHHFSR